MTDARFSLTDGGAPQVSQDRLTGETFLAGLGLATVPFAAVDGPADLPRGAGRHRHARDPQDPPGFGYDGKGQGRVMTARRGSLPEGALATLQGAPAIAEGFVRWSRARSAVIAARGATERWRPNDPGVECPRGRHPQPPSPSL